MTEEICIDKSIYLVDHEDKSFRLLRRNKTWRNLSEKQNLKNKKLLDGYTKILTNDKTKKYYFNSKSGKLVALQR